MPKKPVAPNEKVEKASGNLDDIKAPVVTICRKVLDNKKGKDNTQKISTGSLQYQSAGSILIMSG